MGKRRNYTAEYKAKLVIEVLREEETLSEIASQQKTGGRPEYFVLLLFKAAFEVTPQSGFVYSLTRQPVSAAASLLGSLRTVSRP